VRAEPVSAPLLRDVVERWAASRVDISEATRVQHRSSVGAVVAALGERPVDTVTPADVAELVATLTAKGRKRETIRKAINAGAMVFDFAGYTGERNPFRDKVTVRLPREDKAELAPPSAEHVLAVHHDAF